MQEHFPDRVQVEVEQKLSSGTMRSSRPSCCSMRSYSTSIAGIGPRAEATAPTAVAGAWLHSSADLP